MTFKKAGRRLHSNDPTSECDSLLTKASDSVETEELNELLTEIFNFENTELSTLA
jgi:hypothetical protein